MLGKSVGITEDLRRCLLGWLVLEEEETTVLEPGTTRAGESVETGLGIVIVIFLDEFRDWERLGKTNIGGKVLDESRCSNGLLGLLLKIQMSFDCFVESKEWEWAQSAWDSSSILQVVSELWISVWSAELKLLVSGVSITLPFGWCVESDAFRLFHFVNKLGHFFCGLLLVPVCFETLSTGSFSCAERLLLDIIEASFVTLKSNGILGFNSSDLVFSAWLFKLLLGLFTGLSRPVLM